MSWLRAFLSVGKNGRRRAKFVLAYEPTNARGVTVGHLEYDGEAWTFRYDDDYKARTDLRPIEGFDELDRVYRSRVLFPFFAVRVPEKARRDIREILEGKKMPDADLVDMLREFGHISAATPELALKAR